MSKGIGRIVGVGVILMAVFFAVSAWSATDGITGATSPKSQSTLDNLITAHNGEINANARYLAFAQKADEEGYGAVASLFRAAARAEQVHFERQAKIIKQLGGVLNTKIETPVVKTTKENLEAAFNGETYEYTVMYKEFLAQAEKENNKEAIDVFEDAQAAENVHANLYKNVLDNLDAWKKPKKDFYVCPLCGNVVTALQWATCPICKTPAGQFMLVS